jgi:hypothetical protein
MKNCTNCGEESDGKYCHNCGQEIEIKRLEVKTIFKDVTHGILHWENSILKTFKKLLFKPGDTVRNYISGRRKLYVKPFTYFIFIQTVYVVFFHRMSGKYFAFLNFTITDPESMHEKVQQMQNMVSTYINYFNYFMPIFFALFFYLFFRKKTGVNYAESIAISFYWIGTTLIFGIALMMLSLIEIRIWNARIIVNIIFLLFAILQFTGLHNPKSVIKGIITVILSYITYATFVGLILLIYFYLYM